ncbi:ATP synthase F1 subunit delta [Buchnera aphidicola (Thelaxes californica)]|uniref:ATP synthase subunit delta n=1 Tax=Buchnera aphidicola (Thelaxes californica) TaxID=1315998 RepID=A0A4D6YEU3_9GAMM|nr:ATP synthase F1 subunit delta [Buchnera aphidicola]QCI26563.1 ATP synthase F1 subunit delta [Buchnera aphidicola (Thelaxes californica)]
MLYKYTKKMSYPYSKAAFFFSKENDCIIQWHTMLTFIAKSLQNPLLKNFKLGILGNTYSIFFFNKIFGKYIDKKFNNFIKILIENKRLFLINKILYFFIELWQKEQKIKKIEITTATKLNNIQLQKIQLCLEKKFLKNINLIHKIDPSIIGGMIIKNNMQSLDGSVKKYLYNLKFFLQKSL